MNKTCAVQPPYKFEVKQLVKMRGYPEVYRIFARNYDYTVDYRGNGETVLTNLYYVQTEEVDEHGMYVTVWLLEYELEPVEEGS